MAPPVFDMTSLTGPRVKQWPLPTLNNSSSSNVMLADERLNALASSVTRTVAAPAERPSKRCAVVKSVVSAVTPSMRPISSDVRGITFKCGSCAIAAYRSCCAKTSGAARTATIVGIRKRVVIRHPYAKQVGHA